MNKGLKVVLTSVLSLSLVVQPVLGVDYMSQKSRLDMLSPDEQKYLQDLAKTTWDNIVYMVHEESGLPRDNNDFNNFYTSVSNIGIYAASLVAAVEMDFISKKEGYNRAKKMMVSLEKFQHWRGFCQSWNNVATGEPARHDPWISVLDSGNLAGGLIVLKNAFPKLSKRVGKYVNAMEWDWFIDPATQEIYGGYNTIEDSINKNWKLIHMGTDSRLASAIAIGLGRAPAKHWDTLVRGMETRYGLSYLLPGWQGGGLFMQFISDIFLNTYGTMMGEAAMEFAYAQIFHARVVDSPVWGWSASDSPKDGYRGYEAILDRIVTPHASSLPVSMFPKQVVKNLQKLEEMKVRPLHLVRGESRAFGFRDAVDVTTGEITSSYLLLDQCMLFLSLANLLEDGVIHRAFEKDEIAKNIRKKIPDFQVTQEDLDAFWKKAETIRAKGTYISVSSLMTDKDYEPKKNFSYPVRVVWDQELDGKSYQCLWRVMDSKSGKYIKSGKKKLKNLPRAVSKTFQFSVDLKLQEGVYLLQAALMKDDDKIVSDDSVALRISPKDSPDRKKPLPEFQRLSWEDYNEKWTQESFPLAPAWQVNGQNNASGKTTYQKKGRKETVSMEFSLANGNWIEFIRPYPGSFEGLRRFAFEHKYKGSPVRLEFKIVDQDGSVFGFNRTLVPDEQWVLSRADISRLNYYWGGDSTLDKKNIKQLTIAVSGANNSKGTVEIRSFDMFYKK